MIETKPIVVYAFNHLVNAAFRVQPLSLDCGH